ncbi:MAG TPA: betaine--homocysteine S-methyltransferase [Devosia sp.]|nr:betaine--homocysteine S-methyltransferase [Devosia sp.]
MSKFLEMLEKHPVLLADGATGTNLFDKGLESGMAPEIWNLELADNIRELHQSFVDAGSDILVTNSFGGSARRLHLHNLHTRVHEINARAAEIAAEIVAKSGRSMVVAGSVGPTGDLFAPLGELTYAQGVEVFIEQIAGLEAGGADVAWIETMSAPEEIDAAIEAANEVGLPYTVTVSFDTAGRSMMGLAPGAFATSMTCKSPAPAAIGSNCGVGASDLLFALLDVVKNAGDLPVIAKANAGVPQVRGDAVHYSGTPDLMEDYARLAIDVGARIIGGCCGNTPEHVARMRKAIDNHKKGASPSRAELEEALGALVAPPATGEKEQSGRRRRRTS